MWRYLRKVVRTRPKTTLLVFCFLLAAGAGLALYGYALKQWEAAQLALKDNRSEEAQRHLGLCLLLWPRSVPVHLMAARAARLDRDFVSAEAHLNRCLKLNKGASEAVQLEFLLLRVQAGEEEVVPALIDLVDKKHSETPLILETLARYYMHHLSYQPAYACLSGWLQATPNEAKAYHWRGWVQERLNKPKSAMDDYQRALQLDPDLVSVRLRVAEMLLEDKDPVAALPLLERLTKQFPARPDIMARMGQCRYLQGEPAEARRLLEAALKELPNDLPLLLHLAKLELQENRPELAERFSRRMLEIDTTDTEAHYTLVAALQAQGRRQEAVVALEQFERQRGLVERINNLLKDEADRPSRDPKIAAEIGTHLLRIGREPLALYWLEQALQRDPSHQPARRALADHYQSKGEQTKADAHRQWLGQTDKVTK